ncbi:hypothetical protein AWB85_17940 [Mycobacteroides immunogenum]|uniref:DUF2207 domain-containing protein n=1 Tax=Mycobacteroides immunogenum TaxID=83262 RepID=A0A179V6D4_9MYCO|nr:DUF2207 domain-containing protein [Mycobacteroides immunogenum]OAT66581.1 hypothetical protein AWB85_17940 [Mycobacteroides immunogenum]
MTRGVAVRLALCLTVCAGWILMAAPASADPPPATVAVAMTLTADGALNIAETINPAKDKVLQRHLALDMAVEGNRTQHFEVSDVATTGDATAAVDGNTLITTAAGPATVTYTVRGTVADIADHQQVLWPFASGWDSRLHGVTGSFASPSTKPSSPTCTLGPAGAQIRCTAAQVDHTGVVRVQQDDLPPDTLATFTVIIPAGTVPATASFSALPGQQGAFALTAPGIAALTGLGVISAALAAWVLIARRRDARAGDIAVTLTDPLVRDETGTRFAAPDGVLPGQVGTVIDLSVDAVDLTATVVDLAVRGYLWIAETTGPGGRLDWQISRRAPADGLLASYEAGLLDMLLPEGTPTVFMSSLHLPGPRLDLGDIPDAMYADAQRHGWFRRAPEHLGTLARYGIGVLLAGLLVTAVLAISIGNAMVGVALCGLGAVCALAGMLLPVRTARGHLLVAHVAALRRYLGELSVDGLDAADTEIVLTRAAPYAIVLGQLGPWLDAMTALDTGADGSPGIDWYETTSGDTANMPAFLTTLDGVLARGAHLRNLPHS